MSRDVHGADEAGDVEVIPDRQDASAHNEYHLRRSRNVVGTDYLQASITATDKQPSTTSTSTRRRDTASTQIRHL